MANSSSFTLVFDKWLDESKISQSLINGFVDKVKDQQRNIKQKGLFEVSRTLRHIYVLCLCRSRTFSYFLLRSPALFEQGATFWAHSPSLSLTMEDANKVKKKHIIARAFLLCLKKLTSSGQKYCKNIAIIYQSTESFYFVEGMPIFQKRQDSSFCATKSRL